MELWKDIPDYNGIYQISSLGRIRNNKTNKILANYLNSSKENKTKYYKIDLMKNGKKKKEYVHRLVARTFLGLKSNSNYQVDHINNNSLDNNVCNLQILSQKDNLKKQMKNMAKNFSKYENNIIRYIFLGEKNE